MKKLLLLLQEKQILVPDENNFIIFSLLLHLSIMTVLSYSPVTTRLSMPASEIDMLDVEALKEQSDEIKVEIKPDIKESDEPQYIERKVLPVMSSKAVFYLPIFEVNIPPKIRNWIDPNYPENARQAGIEASVIVEVDIDEHGSVVEARIVRPAGRGFDESAVAAIKRSKFTPAIKGGKPVPVRVRLPIKFELE